MDRTPYFDRLSADSIARIDADDSRAYLQERMRPAAPEYPPHGTRLGRIVLELHGQTVEAVLLSTGKHCRSFGIEIDGVRHGPMGLDRAWGTLVSPAVRRPCSIRHCW